MPKEGPPEKNPENNLFVVGLRARVEEGLTLEEAIKEAEEHIEKSKSYDSAYPKHKALLEEAVNYLRGI